IARFAAAVTSLAVVRYVGATVSRRALLGSGRSLQDEVFARVHDSALLSSGAIPRPSMVSRCTSYVDRVVTALRRLVTSGIPEVMNLLLSIVLLLWIDVRIGLIMSATVALFEVARRVTAGSWSRTARHQIDLNTAVGEAVDDAVTAERATRFGRAEAIDRRRFGALADRVRAATSRLGSFATGFDVAALVVGQFGVIVITAVVGIARTDLSVGQATAAVLYAQAVAAAIAAVPPVVIELQEAAPYMRRLQRVLLSPTRRTEPLSPVEPPRVVDELVVDAIETDDLDGQPVLRGVSCVARRGVVTAVVGAGPDEAEHVVGVLGGLEPSLRGSVSVGGVATATLSTDSLRALVHVVPRDVTLFATSLEDNITLGEPSRLTIADAMSRSGLDEFAVGLRERISSPVGADRRRVGGESLARLGLARAVSSTAHVVIIEDPTQALDREAAQRWWTLARTSLADRVVVIVTDQVDVLQDDDAVVVLRAGAVAEVGSRHSLLETGRWFPEVWKRWSAAAGGVLDSAAVPMLAGLDGPSLEAVAGRMVTERYDAGDPIFVAGEPADRVFVVLDGRVDLSESGRRIASVGPGGYFGDVTVERDDVRSTTARARGPVVVRSLHRLAVSPGLIGVIDRTPAERRVFGYLTRRGMAHVDEITHALPDLDVGAALSALVAAGLVVAGGDAGSFRPAPSSRRPRSGVADLLR
ncbi:MAG: cyclic nucleotide-binding domain-containing protein, partial [Ilumatobacteraceae bacterium]